MDLDPTREQKDFRAEVRNWLKENIPKEPLPSMDTQEGFELHRTWEKKLFENGWSVITWPEKYGGRNLGVIEWLIFEEEYYHSGAPGRVNTNGINLLAPALFDFGSDEQKSRFLQAMASGEEIWAQGWSEPDAGSDLASIKTKAQKDGEWFVINGQKTWCSRGAWADWIFCIVRTDPDSERHQGLSYLLVPADSEGLDRRPVKRLDGEPAFAEIFFDDCRVHKSNLLGGEGEGWSVAMSTASNAERKPDPSLTEEVVDSWVRAHAYRWQAQRTATRIIEGESLNSEPSIMKVFWSELDVELHATALRILGNRSDLITDWIYESPENEWLMGYLFALAGPIYAGTNEIQRNIIAERVLGLPRK